MSATPTDPFPDGVPEADWAEQHTAAESDPDELMAGPAGSAHSVTTEADSADLAEQDTPAYLEDDEV